MNPERRCIHLFFRLAEADIAYVRFIVESYEGLAQVTSLPGRGEVELVVPAELAPEAMALAAALGEEITLAPIERPADWPE